MKWWAIYTNLPVNAIVRLPHPPSGDSQGQETFLAASADKQTCNYDIYRYIYIFIYILLVSQKFEFLRKSSDSQISWPDLWFMTWVSREGKASHSKPTFRRISQKSLFFLYKKIEIKKKVYRKLYFVAFSIVCKTSFFILLKKTRKENSASYSTKFLKELDRLHLQKNSKILTALPFLMYNFYLSILTIFKIKHISS